MTQSKHTPTPLTAYKNAGSEFYFIRDQKRIIAKNLKKEDAAFIVKAANCHEELLEIIEWLFNERDNGTDKGLLPDGLLIKASAALTKAKGE